MQQCPLTVSVDLFGTLQNTEKRLNFIEINSNIILVRVLLEDEPRSPNDEPRSLTNDLS